MPNRYISLHIKSPLMTYLTCECFPIKKTCFPQNFFNPHYHGGIIPIFIHLMTLVVKSECWLWEQDCISQCSLFRFPVVSSLRPKNSIKHDSWELNINLEWNWSSYWKLLLRQVPLFLPFLVFQVQIRPLQWDSTLYTM